MADEKKFYYIKLEDGYFGSKFQRTLRNQANGVMCIVYLKMQLKYAHSNGYIKYDGLYPTFEEEVAVDIDENVENVRITLAFLNKFEYIISVSEYEFCLVEMQKRIGSKTDAAVRMKNLREQRLLLV